MLRVLIPTDFSVQADYAYLMTRKLEEKMPLEVHVLHVLNLPDTVTLHPDGTFQTCGEIDPGFVQQQLDIASGKMQDLTRRYGMHIHTHLLAGKLTDAIVTFAERNGVDLIVMGTKGAWGLREKFSGSETQNVARRCRVPVLSLMCDRSELVIRDILLIHDFRKPEKLCLDLLRRMLTAFGANLHLLQITSGNAEQEQAVFEQNARQFAEMNELPSFSAHLIHDRDVEQGVVHFNQMRNMDLIFIGTHGKSGLLHSSVTEKLINHLYKPIVSFHLN
ncbi:MAG: universal stress protein [Chitinophagales bacterium]|nr:universal stress protein [Chitinophagales bacterium]